MNARYVSPLLAGGALLCLLAIGVLFATGAQAQTPCGPRAEIVQQLSEKYHETAAAIGTNRSGMLMEIFASDEGTWTIVLTRKDGISCLADVGENFERQEVKPKGDGA